MSDDKRTYRLTLTDEDGNVIGKPKNLRMDNGISGNEWAIEVRARELYRDYLLHIGEWNPQNRAKLKKFWTGEPR